MFSFREGEPIRLKNAKLADPNEIGNALSQIAAKNGGELRPHDVVDAAKAKNHPLHRYFEWDDKIAANAYRVDQARALIRIVRVEVDEDKEPVRAFLSVKDDGGQRYQPVEKVLTSASMQIALLKAAKKDLESFRHRYGLLRDLFEPINAAMTKIERRIADGERRAAA
jgi:hypothetical protein